MVVWACKRQVRSEYWEECILERAKKKVVFTPRTVVLLAAFVPGDGLDIEIQPSLQQSLEVTRSFPLPLCAVSSFPFSLPSPPSLPPCYFLPSLPHLHPPAPLLRRNKQ